MIPVIEVHPADDGGWEGFAPMVFGSDDVDVIESLDGLSTIEADVRIGRQVRRMTVYLDRDAGWITWAELGTTPRRT